MPQYLTPADAAKVLSVTPAAIYKWAGDGTIPEACVLRAGRTVRIRSDFIEQMQQAQQPRVAAL